jgi:hypothetical protein
MKDEHKHHHLKQAHGYGVEGAFTCTQRPEVLHALGSLIHEQLEDETPSCAEVSSPTHQPCYHFNNRHSDNSLAVGATRPSSRTHTRALYYVI